MLNGVLQHLRRSAAFLVPGTTLAPLSNAVLTGLQYFRVFSILGVHLRTSAAHVPIQGLYAYPFICSTKPQVTPIHFP